ncbi:uncharacterized protein zbtb4 [Synchiropus splendidus]|uniref:uncharacterized protein zbtb4 n=1 Tax=Synchiropus splendidus TaxID=270530 RepID=UPI00237EADF9|nr:uncharacterized protein zbtb4 [Synchiropus splendidus]XP_053714900.1 uncharacterized protein zbtb4 [Synchiropus splendidus]XP_053714901.1 uncharacterized protein zbtb4 [Synchiropus splendidus]XP_053714902.1 uncharacterized protein zbtb4 [Synchiropus splendidus]XP_053714903.1 uncharacterized protein zbtb4 [Synchiropus splendidus]
MKGKRHGGRIEAMKEDQLEEMADGPKNAKITLSFPISAAPLPVSLSSPKQCHSPSSSSPSPHRRRPSSKSSDEGSLWKLDSTMDVKHRSFKPPRHDNSPSSSPSSSPFTIQTLTKKDMKSQPPKCSKLSPGTQFLKSPPRSSSGSLGGSYVTEGWEEKHRLNNGTVSPSQTAKILFSLGTASFQRGRDGQRKDKLLGRPAGKGGGPTGPSLHPPTLHLPPPLPTPTTAPVEGLITPPHLSSFSSSQSLKPELICGVCHRLFSSAASLTVHMRLHRGSRGLSCRFCGKVFIHSKRLQSHEASCRISGLPPNSLSSSKFTMQPKEEPLEEGEVRVEGGVIVGETDISKVQAPKGAGSLLECFQGDDAAATELLAGDDSHFVKVIDGNVIYFCSVCERSYMTLSSLKRHSNVHSWRRKYPCHYCDKVFALAEYRTKHEVWHTGERRYQCIFCWDAFATYYNLKTHQKTIHGINPSLISSEKTANGGYKQKANALKLYRLLPMRSQKRPYKTYSDSVHHDLLLQPAKESPLSLTGMACPLGPEDLHEMMSEAQSVKPDPDAFLDGFPVPLNTEQMEISALHIVPEADVPHVRKQESEHQDKEQSATNGGLKTSSSSKTKTPKTVKGTDRNMPSVITYGHTKPSVIVHGTAVSSSVIVHSNQVVSENEQTPVKSRSLETSTTQTLGKGTSLPAKRPRYGSEHVKKKSRDSSDTTDDGSRGTQDAGSARSVQKSQKSHSRCEISASKQLSSTMAPQVTGPLCQITVRIGEEAIVKRSISETDLRRDKSRSPPKNKRSETSGNQDAKQSRHSHHHHKHQTNCKDSFDAKGGNKVKEGKEAVKKSARPNVEIRKYYFRQEVREQESDHDMEDNLWRPYYSYKPKRKAQAHLQRVKSWQRKLKYKHSIRVKRRAERIKNLVHSEKVKPQENRKKQKIDEPKFTEPCIEKDRTSRKSDPFMDKKDTAKVNNGLERSTVSLHSSETPSTPGPSLGFRRQPWANVNVAECGTCGRWFSSSRKRDKHELSHLLEFMCLLCRATFPSRDKLEIHQRAQHPKPSEVPTHPAKVTFQEQTDKVTVRTWPEKNVDEKSRQIGSVLSACSTRLSRRALSRHTCPQCHKVCKTSSALIRHVRRHELTNSPERQSNEKDTEHTTEKKVDSVNSGPEKDPFSNSPSVSVISYLPQEQLSSPHSLSSQQNNVLHNDVVTKPPLADMYYNPEKTDNPHPDHTRELGPMNPDSPLERPVNKQYTNPEVTPVLHSALHSVLVLNGTECLDYRKKNLDSQTLRSPSPLHILTTSSTSPTDTLCSKKTHATLISTAALAVSNETSLKRGGVIIEREKPSSCDTSAHVSYEEQPLHTNIGVQSLCRSPSPSEAQDLTMSSILARERAIERQTEKKMEAGKQREREDKNELPKEKDTRIERVHHMSKGEHAPNDPTDQLVPKVEPLSPLPSPPNSQTQATLNRSSPPKHALKSSWDSVTSIGHLSPFREEVHPNMQGFEGLVLPPGLTGVTDRPSAHALLLPRGQQPTEPEHQDIHSVRESRQGESTPAGYHAQDFPLPLIVPENYHSRKKQEENLLMSAYPPGALSFSPLGKVIVPNGGDLAKLPFYPDPYHLLYGSQLLAYPYNLAALPVALNIMAPTGDKVEPLPFLPAIFNYTPPGGPYMGTTPHPLGPNPSLYSSNGGGCNKRDSSSKKQ